MCVFCCDGQRKLTVAYLVSVFVLFPIFWFDLLVVFVGPFCGHRKAQKHSIFDTYVRAESRYKSCVILQADIIKPKQPVSETDICYLKLFSNSKFLFLSPS